MCNTVLHRVIIMSKLNWSCTSCGMSAGRKFSVQRHINNQNIHNGSGQVVSYLEYSLGIKEGKYRSQKIPPFTRHENSFFDRPIDKIIVEVENQIVREIAKRIYNKLTQYDEFFNKLESVATDSLIKKNLNDIIKGSNL